MGKMIGLTRSVKGLSAGENPLFPYSDTHSTDRPIFRRNLKLAALAFSTLILNLVDYTAGHELCFFVFYFLPNAIAAWKIDPINSYLISILSATFFFLSEIHPLPSYSSIFFVVWNSILQPDLPGYRLLHIKDPFSAWERNRGVRWLSWARQDSERMDTYLCRLQEDSG